MIDDSRLAYDKRSASGASADAADDPLLYYARQGPITDPRARGQRLRRAARGAPVGCCHDFTVLLCAMARHHGIPARARVGFARDFSPGFHVDHEILAHYRIDFDPSALDLDD